MLLHFEMGHNAEETVARTRSPPGSWRSKEVNGRINTGLKLQEHHHRFENPTEYQYKKTSLIFLSYHR